jgi:hypothetical protein
MSAQEYHARADALERSSHDCAGYDLILEMEAVAAQWRHLADLADLTDTLATVLQATRD